MDLDSYGGTDPLGMFPLFLKRTANVLAPRLAFVFRRLIRLGRFTVCWRVANVTTISKGPLPPQWPIIDHIHIIIIIIIIIVIIIIIKKYWQCKAGRGRLTPYESEDPSPTLPTYRRKEKGENS